MARELTDKQAKFVREYLNDMNGTKAAIRAGRASRSAHVTASKWLKLAKVREAIEEAQEGLRRKAERRTLRLLEEIDRLALCDIGT